MPLTPSQEEYMKYMNMSEKQFLLQIANREVELEFKREERLRKAELEREKNKDKDKDKSKSDIRIKVNKALSTEGYEELAYARYKREVDAPDNKVKKLFKVAIIRAWQMSEEEEESRRREFMFIANYDRNNKLQYDRNYVPYKKKTMYERRSSSKTNWEKDSNEANNISWTGSGCMVSITFLIIVSSILYQFIF